MRFSASLYNVKSACVCLRLREQCLRSEIMSVARVAHVLLLRSVTGNMDVNTLAFKRSELIRNAAIVRKRHVIHKKSTCVCLRISVAAIYVEMQGRPVAGFRCTDSVALFGNLLLSSCNVLRR